MLFKYRPNRNHHPIMGLHVKQWHLIYTCWSRKYCNNMHNIGSFLPEHNKNRDLLSRLLKPVKENRDWRLSGHHCRACHIGIPNQLFPGSTIGTIQHLHFFLKSEAQTRRRTNSHWCAHSSASVKISVEISLIYKKISLNLCHEH